MPVPFQVTFDCTDVDAQARFWAAALDYQLQPPPEGYTSWEAWAQDVGLEHMLGQMSAVVDPEGRAPRILFQRVPEGKTVKNRLHLDLNVTDGPSVPLEERKQRIHAAADRLTALGATAIRTVAEDQSYHIVMTDPEANEFCLH
ncbi:MAG: VOC family protein [Chloroflexota bacterium]|nr:VOC family protein [Chloroflexota bacterium]